MAASNSQKQLLTLIRDFAAEKSQGERRVFNLKKRIEELRAELEVANLDLQTYKSTKETAEQELKGYEVQLSISEASIQTLEARVGSIQDEVSKVGSDVDALKNEEAALRDGFICQMLDLKTKIRKFQEFALLNLQQRICLRTSSEDNHARGEDAEFVDLEKRMSVIVAQTAAEEQECEREQNLHNQLHQELDDSKRRKELIEGIMKDIKDLQDLTRYPHPFPYCLPLLPLLYARNVPGLGLKIIIYQAAHKANMLTTRCYQLMDWCNLEGEKSPSMKAELSSYCAMLSLTGNKQTSELEEKCASVSEELQRRCICPSCHVDNSESLAELLQQMEQQ